MHIDVNVSYSTQGTTTVEFPDGKTWDDVKNWFVKWDTLYITWKDDTEFSVELCTDWLEGVDAKYPMGVSIINPETFEPFDEQ